MRQRPDFEGGVCRRVFVSWGDGLGWGWSDPASLMLGQPHALSRASSKRDSFNTFVDRQYAALWM